MFIFADYLRWHYGEALGAILTIQKNYVIAIWHRFLISQHFRTLFSPWHRRQPSDFGKASTLSGKLLDGIVDFYIRILAAIIRLSIIVTGLLWAGIVFVSFWFLFIFWLLWPVIFILILFKGLSLII